MDGSKPARPHDDLVARLLPRVLKDGFRHRADQHLRDVAQTGGVEPRPRGPKRIPTVAHLHRLDLFVPKAAADLPRGDRLLNVDHVQFQRGTFSAQPHGVLHRVLRACGAVHGDQDPVHEEPLGRNARTILPRLRLAGNRSGRNTTARGSDDRIESGAPEKRWERRAYPMHPVSWSARICGIALLLFHLPALAAGEAYAPFGIPLDFVLFGATLLGVALFHRHTLQVALAGLAVITAYKLEVTGFPEGAGLAGLGLHLEHEAVGLVNLVGLLLGFAVLARHFEDSGVPDRLPRFLPDGWKGAFTLLAMIFVLSSFLDNIAAALIGGTVAASVYERKVHIGFLAAIVGAANAGGAGSVVGDTTTTMMWIAGVSPAELIRAFVPSAVALVIFGVPAALQQAGLATIRRQFAPHARIDWVRVAIVAFILLSAILTNVVANSRFQGLSDRFPFLGVAVWMALLLSAPVRPPEWKLLPEALKGTLFLISLVTAASMMPVEKLPPASWETALGLGFVSAAFDNIPLTALALAQGGYDWAMLAYAVGFGGSMIWFGSSAGVALSNLFPEARSVGAWLRHGWHVAVAYIGGFLALLFMLGWRAGS